MNALGRGLASLIPKRRVKAEDIIERIDSMQEITETDELQQNVKTADTDDQPVIPRKQLRVEEEAEEAIEQPRNSMPPKPLVTPISFDPREEVIKEEPKKPAEKPEPEEKEKELEAWDKHEEQVQHIPINSITVNALQPRRVFNEMELAELAISIQHNGILQPLVVRRTHDNTYELIAGERRLRAARSLGWEKVPCVVRTDASTERSRLELALLENIQRQDLSPIDEALAYKRLTTDYGMSQDEIAERLGKSRVAITNSMRLLNLPVEVQQGLEEGKITSGHARTILMIPDAEKQIKFYHHIIQEGLTVRKSEVRARRVQRTMDDRGPSQLKSNRTQLARRYAVPLEQKFGFTTKIGFDDVANRFEVKFSAHSEGELSELVSRLLNEGSNKGQEELDVI